MFDSVRACFGVAGDACVKSKYFGKFWAIQNWNRSKWHVHLKILWSVKMPSKIQKEHCLRVPQAKMSKLSPGCP